VIPTRLEYYVNRRIGSAVLHSETKQTDKLLARLPRHDEFTLTSFAVGTVTQAVSWLVPILGDYQIVVTPTTAAAFVGFVTATPQAASKTATGCTLIVANRSAQTIAAATFDVLAFPL